MERAWCRGISEDVEVQVSSVILETWEVFLVASACCVLEPREPDGVKYGERLSTNASGSAVWDTAIIPRGGYWFPNAPPSALDGSVDVMTC